MQSITRQDFARWLNEDLSLELRAVVQNINHISRLAEPGRREDRTTQLQRRIRRVVQLASELTTLGSEPTTDVSPPHLGRTTSTALVEDLALERILHQRYQQRLAQARDLELADMTGVVRQRIEEVDESARSLELMIEELADH